MSAPEGLGVTIDAPARAVFTTRNGGTSHGSYESLNLGASTGDDPASVRANRLAVCASLGIDADRVSMCRQVHGADAHVLAEPSRPGRFGGGLVGWPRGDALVTAERGLALVVLAADCLPVLFWRRDVPKIAAAHAGWRGLLGGVLASTAGAVGTPGRIGVAVGPGIGPSHYEVDRPLADRFAARFGESVVRGRHVDLAASARLALRDLGVPGEHIQVIPACTYEESRRWFSHRRDGGGAGRHAGIIWLEAA